MHPFAVVWSPSADEVDAWEDRLQEAGVYPTRPRAARYAEVVEFAPGHDTCSISTDVLYRSIEPAMGEDDGVAGWNGSGHRMTLVHEA
ncbi:MAG: hypothetical protein H7287_10455 [Thermoleophilia bacterium]|nr:hypothetical protein [Thermoleophilia bacterium]